MPFIVSLVSDVSNPVYQFRHADCCQVVLDNMKQMKQLHACYNTLLNKEPGGIKDYIIFLRSRAGKGIRPPALQRNLVCAIATGDLFRQAVEFQMTLGKGQNLCKGGFSPQ